MQERIGRVRSSTVVAAVLALLITSVAAGAAGDFMVLGESNSSGSAQTTLSNSGLGAAFTLRTTNVSTNATGIFGWSSSTSSNATRGVYGRADGPNSYGVYALQNGAAGSGAAIFADGGSNTAMDLRVDSGATPPMKVNSQAVVANLNADEVDGWDAGCMAGTVLSGGLCIETAVRGTATLWTASQTCSNVGTGLFGRGRVWRLPTALELRDADLNGWISIDAADEWSSTIGTQGTDPGNLYAIAVEESGNPIGLDNTNSSHPYRCGHIPLSFDPISIILGAGQGPENAGTQSAGELNLQPVDD